MLLTSHSHKQCHVTVAIHIYYTVCIDDRCLEDSVLGHHPNHCQSHDKDNYKLKVDPFQKKREGRCRLISGNLYAERNRFRKEAVYSKFLAENPRASKHHMTTHPPSVTQQVQKIKRGGEGHAQAMNGWGIATLWGY